MNERLRRAWLRHPLVAFVRHRKLIAFYRQLHDLVRAGIPMPTAFAQLQQYAPDAAMARGLAAVARDVRGGQTLGDALRRHGELFDDANVELLAFAEEVGRLEPVAATVIGHLERVQRQRWEALFGALWPLYLAAGLVFVGPLLGAAQSVSSAGAVGGAYFAGLVSSLGMALAVLALVLGAPFLLAALGLESAWDRVLRRLPVVSAPMRRLAASRLVMGLGLATASGMETLRALRLAAKATARPSVLEDLPRAEARVRAGGTLAEAVAEFRLLDQASLGRLAVAETTGSLDTALDALGRELQESSTRAMRLLILLAVATVALALLVKIVLGLLGVILGPIKTLYDAAGSGKLDG
jgi:type II secretory pathway component PulF